MQQITMGWIKQDVKRTHNSTYLIAIANRSSKQLTDTDPSDRYAVGLLQAKANSCVNEALVNKLQIEEQTDLLVRPITLFFSSIFSSYITLKQTLGKDNILLVPKGRN